MNERILAQEAINRYADHLHSEEKASSTVQNYLRDIYAFTAWLGGKPVTKEAVVLWRDEMLSHHLSANTVNTKLSAVNSLLSFLGWGDCRAKSLKVQQCVFRDPERELTKEDYFKLLNTAARKGQERLGLLVETIAATGIRVSELAYVTVEAAKAREAVIRLKGKIRKVFLPRSLARKLEKYAKRHKITTGEIFRTRTGTPMTRGQIWREMKTLAEKAGVAASKVFPHNLRHLFATVFYQSCQDIVKLADLLGHSSINTTRIYLMTTGVEHARKIEEMGLSL